MLQVQSSKFIALPFRDGVQVNVHVSNVTKDNISVPNPADENNPRVNRSHALSHNENNPTTPEAYWWDRALALSLCWLKHTSKSLRYSSRRGIMRENVTNMM